MAGSAGGEQWLGVIFGVVVLCCCCHTLLCGRGACLRQARATGAPPGAQDTTGQDNGAVQVVVQVVQVEQDEQDAHVHVHVGAAAAAA